MSRQIKHLFIVAFLLVNFVANAQKIKIVSGEYTFYSPETMSITDAKRKALEQARIVALEDGFGTIVNQSNTTVMINNNSETDENFVSLNSSDVKGEWIEDLEEPQYSIVPGQHFTAVTCKVKGKAREIVAAKIQYDYKILRNGRDKRFESLNFKDGDDMYLYFLSPVSGYLMIFLLDETTQTVYSLLPYKRDLNSAFFIEKNKEYILFSPDDADPDIKKFVDEYVLSCDEEKEYNTLYVLFTTDKIFKGTGYSAEDYDLPESISFAEFRSRLGKMLAKNPDIQYSQTSLSITK